ncbi:hypothetical protein [Streptomyces sp.]|uniref:hypothetical protein n=1 Tax=Streptomyces sp. TaxID=1931 RepID=UPI002D68C701|nr:hypothetical protein [Streptomyces sp.]HZF93134.1 hypothetical protein [Streptomyces sp.]
MSKRQIQSMLRLMASGEPVQVTSGMASVKKLARLAFVAQQFGYEYADVRQGGANNSALVMLIVPDPSPYARTRAAQNWAQYPNAGDGVSLPPFVPDALELLKARINFDLTGNGVERRLLLAALGATAGSVAVGVQDGSGALLWAGILWAVLMGVTGFGFFFNRRRNAKFAARLQAAGFTPVTDESGRVRYLPPGGYLPGHGNPFAQPYAPQQPYGRQSSLPQQPYGQPHPPQQPYAAPGPYAHQPYPPQQPHPPYAQQPPAH